MLKPKRIDAPIQNLVLTLLLQIKQPMSLKDITKNCQLPYHQVARCLLALKAKGYIKRLEVGKYEVTEKAKLIELLPETQIKTLQNRVNELEQQIKIIFSRTSTK